MKSLACFTLLLVLMGSLSPSLGLATTPAEASRAMQEARQDAVADTTAAWYVFGGACGCIGFLWTVVASNPTVPSSRFIGKSAGYITIYTEEYKSAVRRTRLKKVGIGWGISAAASLLLLLTAAGDI